MTTNHLQYPGSRFNIELGNKDNVITIHLIRDNYGAIEVHGQKVNEIVSEAKRIVEEHPDATLGVLVISHRSIETIRRHFYVNKRTSENWLRDLELEELLNQEEINKYLSFNKPIVIKD